MGKGRPRARIYRVSVSTVIDVDLRRELDEMVDEKNSALSKEIEEAIREHLAKWRESKTE